MRDILVESKFVLKGLCISIWELLTLHGLFDAARKEKTFFNFFVFMIIGTAGCYLFLAFIIIISPVVAPYAIWKNVKARPERMLKILRGELKDNE